MEILVENFIKKLTVRVQYLNNLIPTQTCPLSIQSNVFETKLAVYGEHFLKPRTKYQQKKTLLFIQKWKTKPFPLNIKKKNLLKMD